VPIQSIRLAVVGFFAGTVLMGLPTGSQGQAVSLAAPQSAPTETGESMSLGDLARMVRANKEHAPKATKVIDDENLPRTGGGISVVGSNTDRRGGGAPGKMTLLDFWASWCGPCRESLPDLKALQRTYGSDQLEVISVNEDKNENAGRHFAAESGMNWEVQFDPGGQTSRQYGVQAYPTFILMDSNGREVQRFVGEDPAEPLAVRIAPYMPKAPKRDS